MKLIAFNREIVPEGSEIEQLLKEYGYELFPMEVEETDRVDDLELPIIMGKNCTSSASTFYFIVEK